MTVMPRIIVKGRQSAALFSSLVFLFSFAAARAETVSLGWDKNPEQDIAGYRLYYGTTSGVYPQKVEVDPVTTTASLDLYVGGEYFFVVTAYNSAGTEGPPSNEVAYTVTASAADRVLLNVSTRGVVKDGDDVMIGGFIVTGTNAKQVVLRAIGPSLAEAGVTGFLPDPELELYDVSGTLIKQNDNADSIPEEILAAGLAPRDPTESLITAWLSPGTYTCIVRGVKGSTGVALCEVYDLSPEASHLGNISTRGRVGGDDSALIGGLILGGQAPTKLLFRAIGPSLTAFGVSEVLPDPMLSVYDSNGSFIFSDDNWRATQEAQIIDSAIPPSDDRESAIVATLTPGAYTAVVQSSDGTSGVALVEVYNLDD